MSITCRILAIDGGGIRGIIPAYILQQLEAAPPVGLGKPIYQCFDIIAGTSTGGLIALALTTPTPPYGGPTVNPPLKASSILDLYVTQATDIFVSQGDSGGAWYWGTNPNNTSQGIEPWLQKLFPGVALSQAQQQLNTLVQKLKQSGQQVTMPQQVLTTCFTVASTQLAQGSRYNPYLFNWNSAVAPSGADDDYYIWEAARATSAAPTYFPIANVGGGTSSGPKNSKATQRWAVDGGVTANNPAMYALAQALGAPPAGLDLSSDISEVLIVSLGTGVYDPELQIGQPIGGVVGNWSFLEWGYDILTDSSPLVDVLTISNAVAPDQQLSGIMPNANYFRLDPILNPYYAMDDTNPADIKDLQIQAANYISSGEGQTLFQGVVAALKASTANTAGA